MKTAQRILFLAVLTLAPLNFGQAFSRVTAYVWFDLGNVLVETREGFDHLHWMPGAVDYLRELRSRGYRIGLITNIPEDWGQPGDRPSKIRQLQAVINQGWIDSTPFDLSAFDEVLVPVFQREAKPAPKLFVEAFHLSQAEGRIGVFEGENPREVEAAQGNGMSGHLVVYRKDGKTPEYFPIDRLPR